MSASKITTPKAPKAPKAPKVVPKAASKAVKPLSANRPTGFTRCSGCSTAVSVGTTPSTCKTCEQVKNKELFACQCGSTQLKVYRAKGFAAKNCIRCIFLGHQDVRTAAQEEAVERYQVCDGICGLVQPIGRGFCRDCQAVADVNQSLRAKLNTIRAEKRTQARDSRWNQTLWSGAFAEMDAKAIAKKAAAEAERVAAEVAAKALIDEQAEEENLLRILQFAQSGKARVQGLSVAQVDATKAKTVRVTTTALPVSVPAPAPVVILHPKMQGLVKPLCRTESLVEFPLL